MVAPVAARMSPGVGPASAAAALGLGAIGAGGNGPLAQRLSAGVNRKDGSPVRENSGVRSLALGGSGGSTGGGSSTKAQVSCLANQSLGSSGGSTRSLGATDLSASWAQWAARAAARAVATAASLAATAPTNAQGWKNPTSTNSGLLPPMISISNVNSVGGKRIPPEVVEAAAAAATAAALAARAAASAAQVAEAAAHFIIVEGKASTGFNPKCREDAEAAAAGAVAAAAAQARTVAEALRFVQALAAAVGAGPAVEPPPASLIRMRPKRAVLKQKQGSQIALKSTMASKNEVLPTKRVGIKKTPVRKKCIKKGDVKKNDSKKSDAKNMESKKVINKKVDSKKQDGKHLDAKKSEVKSSDTTTNLGEKLSVDRKEESNTPSTSNVEVISFVDLKNVDSKKGDTNSVNSKPSDMKSNFEPKNTDVKKGDSKNPGGKTSSLDYKKADSKRGEGKGASGKPKEAKKKRRSVLSGDFMKSGGTQTSLTTKETPRSSFLIKSSIEVRTGVGYQKSFGKRTEVRETMKRLEVVAG